MYLNEYLHKLFLHSFKEMLLKENQGKEYNLQYGWSVEGCFFHSYWHVFKNIAYVDYNVINYIVTLTCDLHIPVMIFFFNLHEI